MNRYTLFTVASSLVPMLALAASLEDIFRKFGDLINALTPIIFGVAAIIFFWGLAMFLLKAGDEEARDAARQQMIWSIIALFVMVSVWGLVNVLIGTFNLDTSTPRLPEVPRR